MQELSNDRPLSRKEFAEVLRKYNMMLRCLDGHVAKLSAAFEKIVYLEQGALTSRLSPEIMEKLAAYSDFSSGSDSRAQALSQFDSVRSTVRNIRESFMNTLMNEEWVMNASIDGSRNMEKLGNFSNTFIFRNFNIGTRRITTVNNKLTSESQANVKDCMRDFADDMYYFYHNMYLCDEKMSRSITGFVKGRSYIDHASMHLGCRAAVSIDISKFYDSISLAKIVEGRMFYNSLSVSFTAMTGLPFEASSFSDPMWFTALHSMFGILNVNFITIMNGYTHNGILPTGANYSPVVSNLLFASMDKAITDNIASDQVYTRYADDICISTKNAYAEDGSFSLTLAKVLEIESVVNNCGFYLNYDKTEIMGPRDRKKVSGIILDSSGSIDKLSIGSSRKLELKNKYCGKDWGELTSSDHGTLEWVRSINSSQYDFIVSEIRNVPEKSPYLKRNPIVKYSGTGMGALSRIHPDPLSKEYGWKSPVIGLRNYAREVNVGEINTARVRGLF